jgi:hypothetical protein
VRGAAEGGKSGFFIGQNRVSDGHGVVPSWGIPEAVIPHETQVVRPSLTIESGWGPGGSPAAIDAGSGAPAEALLLALRRAWRNAEGRRLAGASAIAPAGRVARAVGTLLVGAATHDLRGATRGATAGCAPGVARMVDDALARHVRDALPAEAGHAVDAPRPAPPPEPAGLASALGRPSLPPPSWWCREPAWTPRVVAEPLRAAREGSALVAALWPPLPDASERPVASRPSALRRTLALDEALERQAWGILAAELQPAEWSMAPRPPLPATHGCP